jgi:outer membrane protein OmpA-like peptidoglycan-associated protein
MRRLLQSTLSAVLASSLLGSCSSPPKPPTVDESRKRPANSAAAVNLQRCESELHNTRIVANEIRREAAAASAVAARLVAQQAMVTRAASASASAASASASASAPTNAPAVAAPLPASAAVAAPAAHNIVYAIFFDFGSTEVSVPSAEGERLIADARNAPLVMLRGRTDGSTESPGETRVARGRVATVRAFLLRAGVDDWRIRSTWQPTGDFIADNASPEGRARNRRVEIEIYREAPQLLAMGTSAARGQQR